MVVAFDDDYRVICLLRPASTPTTSSIPDGINYVNGWCRSLSRDIVRNLAGLPSSRPALQG